MKHATSIGRPRQYGQGMMEYIIIVALIAIAAIGVYSMFGKVVRSQTAGMAKELSGTAATPQITAAQTAATAAVDKASPDKGLSNYKNVD